MQSDTVAYIVLDLINKFHRIRMHGLLFNLPVYLLSEITFENRIFLVFSSLDRGR